MAQLHYLERYGLITEPFSLAINPRYAYPAEPQVEAVKTLLNVVLGKSALGMCSGQVGLGKTMLARLLHDELDNDTVPCIYLPTVPGLPRQSEAAFLDAVRAEFGLRRSRSGSSQDALKAIAEFAAENDAAGSTTVILLDEAQWARTQSVRAMHKLLTLQSDESQLVQVILFGQNPSMDDAIQENDALLSRVSARVKLRPFDQREVGEMVAYRLKTAGRTDPLFTAEAIKALRFTSRGVPRDICQISNKACILADDAAALTVDVNHIEAAATELLKTGALAS